MMHVGFNISGEKWFDGAARMGTRNTVCYVHVQEIRAAYTHELYMVYPQVYLTHKLSMPAGVRIEP